MDLSLLAPLDTPANPLLIDGILHQATALRTVGQPTVGAVPTDPVATFRSQVTALAELLGDLDSTDWARTVAPYDWSVHDLVAHLLGIERYVGHLLDLWPADHDLDRAHVHNDAAEPTISAWASRPPTDLVEALLSTIAAVIDAVEADASRLESEVLFHIIPLRVQSLLVLRTFELWTHADDIRRATGRAQQVPDPAVLRAMSTVSVEGLPLAVGFLDPEAEGRTFKVVLTGPGGGTWTLGDGPADVTVVADVVDYCRLASRRIEPSDLDCSVTGRADLAASLFEAARAIAS